MKSPCCNSDLVFRFPGGKKNKKNLGKRAGITILKLSCPSCKQKWLADNNEYSHPYQTVKPSGYVGYYFDITSEQAAWLKQRDNKSETVRYALTKLMQSGIYQAV